MEMLPKAVVAPEVTFSTIADKLSELKPVISISPKAAVAPPVMLSIASNEITIQNQLHLVILSNAPPTSEGGPCRSKRSTTVPTNSLVAAPYQRHQTRLVNFETEVEVIFLKMVSVGVAPLSMKNSGDTGFLH